MNHGIKHHVCCEIINEHADMLPFPSLAVRGVKVSGILVSTVFLHWLDANGWCHEMWQCGWPRAVRCLQTYMMALRGGRGGEIIRVLLCAALVIASGSLFEVAFFRLNPRHAQGADGGGTGTRARRRSFISREEMLERSRAAALQGPAAAVRWRASRSTCT